MIKEQFKSLRCICGGEFKWEISFREDNKPKKFARAIIRNSFHMDMEGTYKECQRVFKGSHYAVGTKRSKRNLEDWQKDMLSDGVMPEGLQNLVHRFQHQQNT